MNTFKNKIKPVTVMASLGFLLAIALIIPTVFTASLVASTALIMAAYIIHQKYDINYKYWFSFAGQLCTLIFVSVSFVAGLTFLAGGMA